MKSRYLAAILILVAISPLFAQDKLPEIRSNSAVISIQDGDVLKKDFWTLAPEAKPDIYEADLIEGRAHKVTFVTDVDSISFQVEEGKSYDFIIRFEEKLCYTRIVGTRYVPAAVFDETYRKANRGKILIEIPEVYELINVAIAMTPTGTEDPNMVCKKSGYYTEMRAWFDKFKDHPLLAALEDALKKNVNVYSTLKMNGYAFEYDGKNRIVQSKVYDRTGFAGERSNSLRPYLEQLQSFSDTTAFREFYRKHAATYQEQIAFYRDVADVAEMKRWLDRNFPTSSNYNCHKVIFSPLVAYNQSSTWFESNGFKELQAHVNFPYPQDLTRNNEEMITGTAANVYRGNIVFTELNHGYINPEAEKYGSRILKAVNNWEHWVDKSKGQDYYRGMATFNEYMNWALVSLRLIDYIPMEQQDALIARVERMMTGRRGFPRFRDFDQYLVRLYRNRKPGQTVADLYPQIVEWFEKDSLKPQP